MKLHGFFHTEKPKKNFFEQPNNQKQKTKKLNKSHFQGFVNSQYFFMKISWISPCGHEAGQHKLKNRQKMHFLCFYAIFELMSANLTATLVEQNQCPLHQSILLTQGPIHEIFMKKY